MCSPAHKTHSSRHSHYPFPGRDTNLEAAVFKVVFARPKHARRRKNFYSGLVSSTSHSRSRWATESSRGILCGKHRAALHLLHAIPAQSSSSAYPHGAIKYDHQICETRSHRYERQFAVWDIPSCKCNSTLRSLFLRLSFEDCAYRWALDIDGFAHERDINCRKFDSE